MLRVLLLAALAAVAAGSGARAGAGPVLLTVSGTISAPNRGPVDPEIDKLLAFNEASFAAAHEFTLSDLEALPQVEVHADFPKGGPEVTFAGPRLADVLRAAGATGETVTVQAMDGYAVAAPVVEMTGKGAVVALSRNGRALAIGGLGPTQIVFPRAERADLADMPDDWWIWQIYHISVE